MLLPLLLAAAQAADGLDVQLHGNVKVFFLAGDTRPWFGFSDAALASLDAAGLSEADALDAYGLAAAPYAQGTGSGRLLLAVAGGPLRFDAHWAIAAQSAVATSAIGGLGTGVGLAAPELLPLTWSTRDGSLAATHRLDRLVLTARLPHLDLALGRQPVSFGAGRIFTPLDVVNPFHPATIDTEYKPGVDALRADGYLGTSGHLTAVGAWAGDPVVGEDARDPERPAGQDLILAAAGQGTVGVTDLLGFAGLVRGEPVFGAGAVSAIGPVGLHGEATLTLPDGEDPFVRAVLGADGRPTGTTSLSAEVYLQSFGATDPSGYLAMAEDPRFSRGEVWQLGQLYGAVAVAQEITPLVHTSLSIISNLRDPSALLAAGGSWSVADDADVVFGGYAGIGAPPDTVALDFGTDASGSPILLSPDAETLAASVRSEFGLYPVTGYVQVRVYF